MRVLVVHPGPHFSVADVFTGIVSGLAANNVEVCTLNLDDRLNFYSEVMLDRGGQLRKALSPEAAVMMAAKGLEVMLYEWWPDMVVIVSGFFIPPEIWGVLARRPHHVVYWCTESPYEDDRQANASRYADTVILNDPTNLESYRTSINPRTFYLPHSYDPDKHRPRRRDPELACDFAFVGTGFPSRVDFFESVNWDGIDARFGGNWQAVDDGSPLLPLLLHDRGECMDNADAARLYAAAKVTANLYRKEHSDGAHAKGWAMGPREVELAACGSFFLREPRGEGDELFPMLPTFTSADEFESLLRWWLAHPRQRQAAAKAARAAVADRTFANTAAQLLRLVDGHHKVTR